MYLATIYCNFYSMGCVNMKKTALKVISLLLISISSIRAASPSEQSAALGFFQAREQEYKKSALSTEKNIEIIYGADNPDSTILLERYIEEIIKENGLTYCTYMKFLILSDLMRSLTKEGHFEAAEQIWHMICRHIDGAKIIPVSTEESNNRYMTVGIIAATTFSDEEIKKTFGSRPKAYQVLGETVKQACAFRDFDFVEADHQINMEEWKISHAGMFVNQTVEEYKKVFPESGIKNAEEIPNDLRSRQNSVIFKRENLAKRKGLSQGLYDFWYRESYRLRENLYFNSIDLGQLIGVDYAGYDDSDGVTNNSSTVVNGVSLRTKDEEKQHGQRLVTALINRNNSDLVRTLLDNTSSISADSMGMRATCTCFGNNLAIMREFFGPREDKFFIETMDKYKANRWDKCKDLSKSVPYYQTYYIKNATNNSCTENLQKENIFISNPFKPTVIMSKMIKSTTLPSGEGKYIRVYKSWKEIEAENKKDNSMWFCNVLLPRALKNTPYSTQEELAKKIAEGKKHEILSFLKTSMLS
jgi:hypothetical protein